MDSSDEELLSTFATQWEKNLLDSEQKDLFSDSHVDVNDSPDITYLNVLFEKFGHRKFRPLQWKIIKSILIDRRDNCAIMATGYGKSLCYQFPAVYSEGITLVISPLISLMEDQVLSLTIKNISSCLLGPAQSDKNTYNDIFEKKYSLIYLTPEFCTGECGQELLKNMHSQLQVTLIAVDEAHCVSQWGHDFRPSYKQLGVLKDIFPDVPILAVTATATEQVKKDIINMLKLKNPQIVCSGFDRPNLYFSVKLKGSILEDLKSLMIRRNNRWKFEGSTIIYCIRRKDTEVISNLLESYDIHSLPYHAGLPLKTRKETHEKFVKDKVSVIVATIAFGMGIDKPDIRNVIHYGASQSIESYYQEVGRAGRDGLPSKCTAFYNNQDFNTLLFLVQQTKNVHNGMKLLDIMKEYLTSRNCRRQFILSYFASKFEFNSSKIKNCCDNCSQKTSMSDNELYEGLDENGMFDFTEDAVKFLSAVSAMNESFGIAVYVLFLRGSKNSKIHNKYRNDPCYGSGDQKSEDWWKAIASFLEVKKYLRKIPKTRGKFSYCVVGVSSNGLTFLEEARSGKKLLEQPALQLLNLLKKKQHSSGWLSADGSSSSNTRNITTEIKKENKSSITSIGESTDSKTSEVTEHRLKIFRLLKKCRTQLAADNDCKPFMIASDYILMEIAKRKPLSLQQLYNMQIEGLTKAIIDKFGNKFLEIIRRNSDDSFDKNINQEHHLPIFDILQQHPIRNPKLSSSVLDTYSMFKNGLSIEQIADIRQLKYGTILEHFTKAIKVGYPIKMEQLGVSPRVRTTIIQVINNLGTQHSLLFPIKLACPENITYEEIKVVCAYIEVRVHLDKIGIPYREFENFVYKETTLSTTDLKDEAMSDDNDDLLMALCDTMENQVSNETQQSILNQIDNTITVKSSSPSSSILSVTDYEPSYKKIKIEPNSVLDSPPREFPQDISVEEIDIKPEVIEATEQVGSSTNTREEKNTTTRPETKKKLPPWLSKKRKL